VPERDAHDLNERAFERFTRTPNFKLDCLER
jgi:hypothetical protein